jgi:hypothetical protein
MRIIASCAALVVGLVSAGICWNNLNAKNVYFRPVFKSVETGEGDPYMIALDCVAQLSSDLETPIITLTVSMITLFVFAIRNKQSMQSGSPSPTETKTELP